MRAVIPSPGRVLAAIRLLTRWGAPSARRTVTELLKSVAVNRYSGGMLWARWRSLP